MELKDLRIGMQVKITSDKDDLYGIAYQKYAGDTVTITSIDGNCVYVKENNFNWLPWQLEPIEETETAYKFVIKIETEKEGVEILRLSKYSGSTDLTGTIRRYMTYYCKEKTEDEKTVGIAIKNNIFDGWANISFYKNHEDEFGKIYTFAEITGHNTKKEKTEEKTMEKKMKTKAKANNIPKKKELKDFTVKIETIEEWVKPHSLGSNPVTDENGNVKGWKTTFVVTTVTTPQGTATAKHKQGNSVKRKGIMYACAKIMAQKNETNKMLYELGNERVELSIYHEILANHACNNRSFAKTYEKYKAVEEYNYAIDCRCTICGKQFSSPEEAREHEKWHALNRKAKHERYLIRREAREKIAEAQHNEAVAAEIKKLMEAE